MSGGGKKLMPELEIVAGIVIDLVTWGSGGNSLIIMGAAQLLSILLTPNPNPVGMDGIIRSSVANQQIIYGQAITGGVLIFSSAYGSNGSNTNAYLTCTVSHTLTQTDSAGTAGMAISGVEGFMLNDIFIPPQTGSGGWNSGRGTISGTTGSACSIDTYTTEDFNPLHGNFWISFSDGSQTTADPILTTNFGSEVDSNFIGKGICYSTIVLFMSADQGTYSSAFPSGLNTPSTFKAILNGQCIYDPRLDSDNGGTGSQRINDTTTWTFSSNSALVLANYLTRGKNDGGCGYSPGTYSGSSVINSQVNWANVAAAANICDEQITVPAYAATWNGSTWSSTDDVSQYSFNGIIDTATNTDQNVQNILKTMAGWIVVSGSQINMFAGAVTSASGTVDDTYLAGQISYSPQIARSQTYNAVKMTYTEPAADYNAQQAMPIINSTYETDDGGVRLWSQDTISGCNNQYQCQILEIIKSQQSRNKQIIQGKFNLKALQWTAGDVINVTVPELNLSSAPFRIIQYALGSDYTIDMKLLQENVGTYSLPGTPDDTYQAFDVTEYQQLYNLVPSAPGAPTSITATATAAGNKVSWTPPAASQYQYLNVYRSTTAGGASGYTVTAKVVGDHFIDTAVTNGTLYYYYVTAVNYWTTASAAPSLPVSGASCTCTISAANATYNAYNGAWSSVITYSVGAQVSYTGNTWICVTSNLNSTPTTSNANWQIEGPTNLDYVGEGSTYKRGLGSHMYNGVSYNYKGIWSSATAYVIGDEVVYGQAYWICILGNTNDAPAPSSSYWVAIGGYGEYLGAWSSVKAYIQDNEVTYTGNYWICVTGNTNSAPTTSNANWVIAGPSTLDYVADGSSYARIKSAELSSGFWDPSGAGNANAQAQYASSITAGSKNIVPDSGFFFGKCYWTPNANSNQSVYIGGGHGGGNQLLFNGTGSALTYQWWTGGAGGGNYTIPVLPSTAYTLSAWFDNTHYVSGGLPFVRVWDNNGANIGTVSSVSGGLTRESATFTTGASSSLVQIYYQGVGTVITNGYTVGMSCPQLEQSSSMTGYRDSYDTSGFAMYSGSGPVTVPTNTFTYTATCPSGNGHITFSWSSFGYYNADGSLKTFTNGSNTATTSLSASTTYYFYPYVDLNVSATGIEWVAGGSGSTGYAYTARSVFAVSTQNIASRVPLSTGGIAATTPASGGSGGGGGGGSGCLHPSTLVTVNNKIVPARMMKVGDLLLTPDGEQPITILNRHTQHEWRVIRFNNDEEMLVTPTHRYMLPTGELIAAQDLKVKDILKGAKGFLVVTGIAYHEEPLECISLEVEAGYYLTQDGGVINKNGGGKP